MDEPLWAHLHGAATHFPIALTFTSTLLDAAGFALENRPIARDLRQAGQWTMLLAAAGSVAAVFSGLFLTHGSVAGHGLLRLHHLFAWPAFGLLIALAVWRTTLGDQITRRQLGGYLIGAAAMTALIAIAGYWGGELMLTS